MQQAQQTEAKPVLMSFYSDDDKSAWLAGRDLDQLELWERACFECNFIPPETRAEFLAVEPHYPQLDAWRDKAIAVRREQFSADLREKLRAGGLPEALIEDAVQQTLAGLGNKVLGIQPGDVKIMTMDASQAPEDIVESVLNDDAATPSQIIEAFKALIKVKERAERNKCIELIEALDPVEGKRFADVIRQRAKEADAFEEAPCECPRCTAKREKAAAAASSSKPATV